MELFSRIKFSSFLHSVKCTKEQIISSDTVAKYMQVLAMAFCIIFLDMLNKHNKIADFGGLTRFELSSLTGINTTHSFLNHVIGKSTNKTITESIINDQYIQPDLWNEFYLNHFNIFKLICCSEISKRKMNFHLNSTHALFIV